MKNNTMEIIKKVFSFNGRMGRQKFLFMSFMPLPVFLLLLFIAMVIGQGILYFIALIIVIILHACNTVKRLHDINKSGEHYWLSLIPIYNIYFAIVMFTRKGTVGTNRYGEDTLTGGV